MFTSRQKSAESLPKIGFLVVVIWVRLSHNSATFEQRLHTGAFLRLISQLAIA